MKAITILQPWTSLIACGEKKIETRSWETKYRGKIAIHAGKKYQNPFEVSQEIFTNICRCLRIKKLDDWHDLERGKVIAIADLVDCVKIEAYNFNTKGVINGIWLVNGDYIEGIELDFGDYTLGRYVWILENVQLINPVPARGQQRLWNWDEKLFKLEGEKYENS